MNLEIDSSLSKLQRDKLACSGRGRKIDRKRERRRSTIKGETKGRDKEKRERIIIW